MTKTTRMFVENIFLGTEQKVEGFYILYRYGDFTILRCTFCPALLPSEREVRDIVKNDLTA
jgi:hypothetical protein